MTNPTPTPAAPSPPKPAITPGPGIITQPFKPLLVNPFGRPFATQCPQRDYGYDANQGHGGFGPRITRQCNIAPQGRGGRCTEYSKPEGHSIALAFAVASQNVAADFFEFAKDLNNSTQQPMDAYLVSGDGRILGHFTGRDTDTDQPHCWYVTTGVVHNGKTAALANGIYFYVIDTPDGHAANMPVWHNGSNQFN
jgi:hypothetical protein